jgi:hypothetical protein
MATVAMKTYAFTLVLSGVTELTHDMAESIFAACDDASPGSSCGVVSVHFDRDAESLGKAIGSAVADVERAGFAVSRIDVGDPRVAGATR